MLNWSHLEVIVKTINKYFILLRPKQLAFVIDKCEFYVAAASKNQSQDNTQMKLLYMRISFFGN